MAREAARKMQCTNHLKQFGLATHNHHDTFNFFPNNAYAVSLGANTLTSPDNYRWRIGVIAQLLPFLEQNTLYDAVKITTQNATTGSCSWIYSVSQEGGSGIRIGAQPVATFRCPSDPEVITKRNEEMTRSNYNVVLGDFMNQNGYDFNAIRSIFRPGHLATTSFADFLDGSSNTIFYGERVVTFDRSATPVIKGGIAIKNTFTTSSQPIDCLSTISGGGVLISSAIIDNSHFGMMPGRRPYDGRGQSISIQTNLPPNSPTCARGTQLDQADYLGSASSYHPGGVNICFGDASVHFVPETIDVGTKLATNINTLTGTGAPWRIYTGPSPWGVWGAMGTPKGGESSTGL
jgi:prepilin-type processing-associated H-X9-DG protein